MVTDAHTAAVWTHFLGQLQASNKARVLGVNWQAADKVDRIGGWLGVLAAGLWHKVMRLTGSCRTARHLSSQPWWQCEVSRR